MPDSPVFTIESPATGEIKQRPLLTTTRSPTLSDRTGFFRAALVYTSHATTHPSDGLVTTVNPNQSHFWMTCISEGCVGLLCVVFRRRLALRVQVMEVDVSACVGDTAERFIGSCGWVTLHKEEVMR